MNQSLFVSLPFPQHHSSSGSPYLFLLSLPPWHCGFIENYPLISGLKSPGRAASHPIECIINLPGVAQGLNNEKKKTKSPLKLKWCRCCALKCSLPRSLAITWNCCTFFFIPLCYLFFIVCEKGVSRIFRVEYELLRSSLATGHVRSRSGFSQ